MIKFKNDEEIVALGGLLHDIGKLLNRCDSYMKAIKLSNYQHPELSLQFLEVLENRGLLEKNEKLHEIVQKHHEAAYFKECHRVNSIEDVEIRKLATIVSRADNYSSFERRDEKSEKEYFKTKPLDSLFNEIQLKNKEKNITNQKYKLKEIDYDSIFPNNHDKNSQVEISNIVNSFIEELSLLNKENFEDFFISLNFLLKKYTWSIPSDTQTKISDVSLYNHLKTTSAIALASYKYHKEKGLLLKEIQDNSKNRFLIIGGKLDGDEQYRYDIATSKQSTKRLRGRNVKIELIKRCSILFILEQLNLTICNFILEEDGTFFIIAPNLQSVKTKLIQIGQFINCELVSKYNGEISLKIEKYEASGKSLKVFNKIILQVQNNLNLKGNGILNNLLLYNPIIYNDEIKGLCNTCKKNFVKDEECCSSCNEDINLGKWIVNAKNLVFYKSNSYEYKNKMELICGYKVAFPTENEEISTDKIVYNLNSNELIKFQPTDSFNIGIYAPIDDETNEIINFKDLANLSEGVKNLAILTLNLDRKEQILYSGFKSIIEKNMVIDECEERDYASISRIYTINDFLSYFFNNYIQNLFRNKKEFVYRIKNIYPKEIKVNLKNMYVVKSSDVGVDIIGPWSEMIYVAKILNDEFEKFVSNNKDITLSGNIKLIDKTTPINMVKDEFNYNKIRKISGINFFDYFIKWDELEYELADCEYILDKIKEEMYSESFIYRLLKYNNMAENVLKNNKLEDLVYVAKLDYDIKRNLIPKVRKKYNKDDVKEINKIKELFSMTVDTIQNVDYEKNKMILNYVVRKNRGENCNE